MEKPKSKIPVSSVRKKVRFDLEHEVFLIPSKWENVNKETRKRVPIAKSNGKHYSERARESKTRRPEVQNFSKSKQLKRGKQIKLQRKANIKKRKSATNKAVNLDWQGENKNNSTLKLPYDSSTTNGLVKSVEAKGNSLKTGHFRTKALVKLEMTKRGINYCDTKVVNVLPKITYRPDLKKAIESAFTRSRCVSLDLHLAGLSIHDDSLNKESENSVTRERQTLKKFNGNDRSLVTKRTQKYLFNTSGEQYQKHVNQPSESIDEWTPFHWPVWNEIAKPDLSSRKEKQFSVIPDSILY